MAYFVDVARLKVARVVGDLDDAGAIASGLRTKMAMIGDGTKPERATALIELANLYLDVGHAANDVRGMYAEATSIVEAWGGLPRFERELEAIERRLARAPVQRGYVRGDLALTTAELRVLRYLSSHHTFPEIAKLLYLSTNTVKSHRNAIYRKLQVSSRSEAVDAAVARGLLPQLDDRPAVPS